MKDYFVLSFKNLKRRGIRSWLTLIGVFIGITAVVSLISLGGSLQAAIVSQFGSVSADTITVQAGGLTSYGPPGTGVTNPLTIDDARAIEKLSSVDYVIERSLETGKAEFNNIEIIGYATNVPDGEKRNLMYEKNDLVAEDGRLLKNGDNKKVVLGYNFYVDKVGFGKEVDVGDKILVNGEKFEVVGILKKKGSFIWDNIVLMNDNVLEDLFDYGEEVDIIAVYAKDEIQIEKTKEDIEKLMRKRRDVKVGQEDFSVETAAALLETVNSILGGVQAFIIIIASISIVVGAVGIVNTMTTSVLERRQEIGIMKAIGARNQNIFLQFLIESGLVGLIGGFIGVVFGLLIGVLGTFGINNFLGAETLPSINLLFVFFVLLFSFIVGAVAGIVPAMNAAKQNPVEALRD